tara:strand:+ start:780 stop:1265 length:486 start_codon:yes stop_codon:yes gene_type:complete
MAKKFNIHEWQAKQIKKSFLTENTGYDGVIQRYLDEIIDDITGPDITKEEAIEYIDKLSQAILNLKTTIIPDIFNVKQEHHAGEYEPDFLKQSVNTFLDKLKKKTNEGPDYETVEKIMEKHFSARKEVEEISATGTGTSFNAGDGMGYATPKAFKKKNKDD